jgi:Ni/Co efflux regulator RcnB
MRTLTRCYSIGLLSATLLAPVAILPGAALAQDDHRNEQRREAENARRYQDARHHDEHEWNEHEDRAFRMWFTERHRKYNDFDRLSRREQEAYWDWRHNHSDAQLKIEIR